MFLTLASFPPALLLQANLQSKLVLPGVLLLFEDCLPWEVHALAMLSVITNNFVVLPVRWDFYVPLRL